MLYIDSNVSAIVPKGQIHSNKLQSFGTDDGLTLKKQVGVKIKNIQPENVFEIIMRLR